MHPGTHTVYLYFSAMVTTWRCDCDEVGVDVLSLPRRKLVSDQTAKIRLNTVKVTESIFVDDLALYASSCDGLGAATIEFVRRTGKWGLTVSVLRPRECVLVMV